VTPWSLCSHALSRYWPLLRCGVEIRLPISRQITQQHGFVHGGVVSYLADNALTFAGGRCLEGMVVTGEYKINYIGRRRAMCWWHAPPP
jgi:acyl-coenzyme A thioesterase PaaI-like protein